MKKKNMDAQYTDNQLYKRDYEALIKIIENKDKELNQLKQKNKKLAKEHKILDHIFSLTPNHVYCKDKDGVYLNCNDQQAKVLGYQSGKDIVGKKDKDLPWRKGEKIFRQVDKEVMETEQIISKEEAAILPDGKKVVLYSTKRPLYDPITNQVIGIIGISVDITAQKEKEVAQQSEAEAKAKAAEAQATVKAEQDIRQGLLIMSSALAHDLNTVVPILDSSGYMMRNMFPYIFKGYQLALEHKLMTPAPFRQSQLETLKDQGHVLDRQAIFLRDYSDNSLGTIKKAILSELSADDLDALDMKQIVFRFIYEYPFPEPDEKPDLSDWVEQYIEDTFNFKGNAILMYRILNNLAGNSVHAIKKNNYQGNISIIIQPGEDANYLLFMDNAGGAPQHVVEQMFNLNFTTKGEEGNGVGLAFCKKVMRMFGGDIWAESKDEQMVFTLKFPKVVDEGGSGEEVLRLS